MFQKINDPKPVIASETECSVRVASRREAIAKSCNYERVYAIASFRFAPFAMTIEHFFTWSTLSEILIHKITQVLGAESADKP
ncbi:hypothetical protein FDUTEX481_03125 [Tolypothrix sp. PCC 7601]|nr:hypothetical protein FDUTEX481_03125 [Tolypothrix sp. PCC 7601]BAY94815.1 hypothetical protein NIES3275_68690 [Microchaete diplosiphon NIES-3275]